MQETFTRAMQQVLAHEGGYVEHPKDPGGATNKGITLRTFKLFYGDALTKEDLKGITDEQVTDIYKIGYWDQCKCGMLPLGIDYVIFDQAVNSGPIQSVKWLQEAVGVVRDGIVGPKTLDAITKLPPGVIVNAMCEARIAFLKQLRNGESWKTFGNGWMNRVTEVQSFALSLIEPLTETIIELPELDMTFEQYLLDEVAEGKIDFRLRVTINVHNQVTFYVHPLGKNGRTKDYRVDGNTLYTL